MSVRVFYGLHGGKASSRQIMRRLLKEYFCSDGVEFSEGEGKPFIKSWDKACSPPAFNVSHSGEYYIAAIGGECGVDCQIAERSERYSAICKRYFSPEACEHVSSAKEPQREFVKLWTVYESYVKLIGTGFAIPPRGVAFGFSGGSFTVCVTPEYEKAAGKFAGGCDIYEYTLAENCMFTLCVPRGETALTPECFNLA